MRRRGINVPRRRSKPRGNTFHRKHVPCREGEWKKYDITDIFLANLAKHKECPRRPGFCCDIGAPKSVVGRKELRRILKHFSPHHRGIMRSRSRFRLADSVVESLGHISIPLRTPTGVPTIMVELDVVEADIPALLGIYILDKESLSVCTVLNRLVKKLRHISKDGKEIYIDEWFITVYRSVAIKFLLKLSFRLQCSSQERRWQNCTEISLTEVP